MSELFPFAPGELHENLNFNCVTNDGLDSEDYVAHWLRVEQQYLNGDGARIVHEHTELLRVLEWSETTDYQPERREERRRYIEERIVIVTAAMLGAHK